MGETAFALLLAWIGWSIWQGYRDEQKPPIPLRDGGNGIMEPVCPACHARLVTVTGQARGGLSTLFTVLFAGIGVLLLFLFNWLAGALVLIVAFLIGLSGRRQTTSLQCPACGTTAKTMN